MGHTYESISLYLVYHSAHRTIAMKAPDNYCCGSGVCIINDAGECWCGQVWDGEKMTAPILILRSASDGPQEQDSEKLKPES